MNHHHHSGLPDQAPRSLRLGWLAAAALTVATGPSVPSATAADSSTLQSKDKVSGKVAVFTGGSAFTPAGGGHTAAAGDSAADFGANGSGPVYVQDATFINAASANDELTFAFWAKDYNVSDSSVFWANTINTGGSRGFQAHLPWSNNNIYFDTSGCCNPDTRLNGDVGTFPGYSGDTTWWQDWHLFVFSKKGEDKQIWIDGSLFLEGTSGAAPLGTDFKDMYIGSDGSGKAGFYHGIVDDFSIFSTQLTEDDIKAILNGTSPSALDASKGLIAYWDFNDPPSEGQFTTISPAPDASAAAPNLIKIVHVDGGTPWDANSAKLEVDGKVVTPVFSKDGGTATLTYVPNPIFAIASQHSVKLTYPGAGQQKTTEWSFVVGPYTKDSVAGVIGSLTGGSGFTSTSGGHSGAAGDYGLDFGANGTGPVVITDVAFLNTAAANDEMSFALWVKKYDTVAGSAFWGISPSSSSSFRGWQAHLPWDNNNIYFDTAGCCNANQRINADVATFPDYSGDRIWWNDWHHFVFSKKADDKQIWIDGKLFLEGTGASPLPTDFNQLMLGSDNAGGGLFHAVIDDFAVFSTQLTEADIATLVGGASPSTLDAAAGLLALFNFNDIPADGLFQTLIPAPNAQDAGPNLVKVVHQEGPSAWDPTKVSLTIDGKAVSASVVAADGKTTVSYAVNPLFAPLSSHTAAVTYPTAGGTATKSWSFKVGNYTKDVLHSYVGALTGAAAFSADGAGHSGSPGDFAIDLGPNQAGQSVHILDASFMNEGAANDELSVVGWQKLYAIHDSAFYWGVSPTSNGSQRGWGTHTPWSNNNLYFDTAGCCDGTQRTSGPISSFPPYAEVNDLVWWNDWHHFVFQKKASTKEIWIDGLLFLTFENTKPLPTDFTEAFIGFDPADNARLQGLVDDIAVFKTALVEADIQKLASGSAPTDLDASTGLLAFWNFNDGGTPGVRITAATRNGNNITLTWSGGTGPYTIQHKNALSDATWDTVSTTPDTTATVTISGATGFFRISVQ